MSQGEGVGGGVGVRVSGPGVEDTRRIAVRGLGAETFEAVVAANRDFPAGIDTWLVAADRTVVGLPRSARLQVDDDDSSPSAEGER